MQVNQKQHSAEALRSILKWQGKLAVKIKAHNGRGDEWLGGRAQVLTSVSLRKLLEEDEWTNTESHFGPERQAAPPERRAIDLPSSRGSRYCREHPDIAKIEATLRQAQADEHLPLIRVNLVNRANVFRTRIRKARGNARLGASTVTRAFEAVHDLGRTVRLHAQQYNVCRASWARCRSGHAR